MQSTFFEQAVPQPLAARLRPRDLDEFAGQKHLLGPGKVLRRLIENDSVSSMIFWGSPILVLSLPCFLLAAFYLRMGRSARS